MARAVLAAVAIVIGATAPATAAVPAGGARLNGFWNIDDAARSAALGSAKAELTPAGQAVARRNAELQAARAARGEIVGLASFTCGQLAIPFFINTSEPWLLVVGQDEVVQVTERRQVGPRHIYTDGRGWPDLSKLPPSSVGYSIGRWDGGDLLIETRGMPPGGMLAGGVRGRDAVLHERVSVSPDGARLSWSLRWEDPEMMAKPLAYTIQYDRAPPHTYAYVHDCDPNEDAGATVSNPEQETAR